MVKIDFIKNVKRKDWLFVSLQIVLFALYFFIPAINILQIGLWIRIPAFIISLFGILICLFAILQLRSYLSPFPTPVENGKLIQTGAFKISRHPIYSGLILFFSAFAIYQGNSFKMLLSLLLLILFYYKSRYEESLLIKKYPEYSSYKQNTRRFFPFL